MIPGVETGKQGLKMKFTIVTDFSETLGKSKRSPTGEKIRKMYKTAMRSHRKAKTLMKWGKTKDALSLYSRREKLMGQVYKKAYSGRPGLSDRFFTGGRARAASASALSDVGKLRKAAAKGRATTPKGAAYHKSYTMTKLRTALRKATGSGRKVTRGKLLKHGARTFLRHAKVMRKEIPTKLPG